MPTREHPELLWMSPFRMAFGGGQLQVAQRAWAEYLGYAEDHGAVIQKLKMCITAAAAGTETHELALASSPVGPNGAGQNLTMLLVLKDANLDSFIGGSFPDYRGWKNPQGYRVNPRTHLWGIYRPNHATTRPTIAEATSHTLIGDSLILDPANALDTYTTVAFSLPALSLVNHQPPHIWAQEF